MPPGPPPLSIRPCDPRHRIYTGNDRKEVQVEVDGTWYDGELRSWDQADDGTWSGIVSWRRTLTETLTDRFLADRIRRLEADPLAEVEGRVDL